MKNHTIGSHQRFAWMRNQLCCMLMSTFLFLLRQASLSAWITSMNAKAHVTCL